MCRYEILSSCVSELVNKGLLYLPTTSQDAGDNDDIAVTMLYNTQQAGVRERSDEDENDAACVEGLTLAVIAREYTEGKRNSYP